MIADTDEYTLFDLFTTTGVVTTDTFNQWRKKDNGVIQLLAGFVENSAGQGISVNSATATISIKTGGVSNLNLTDGAVTEGKIANSAVTEGKIANSAVTIGKIANSAVTSDKLAANSVIAGKIAPDAITTANIVSLGITSDKLGPAAVIAGKIGPAAVTNSNIADASITSPKLVNGSVTNAKLAESAVLAANIAANAVTTVKIINGAVTNDKLAPDSVTASKIAAGAITSNELASASVTPAKMSGSQGGSAPAYAARAWVNFDGNSGTNVSGEFRCTIRDSGNVTKVVRLSTGVYRIHFTVDMQNTQYAVIAMAGGGTAENEGTYYVGGADTTYSRANSSCVISVARASDGSSSGDLLSPNIVNVVIFQ